MAAHLVRGACNIDCGPAINADSPVYGVLSL